MEEHNGIRESHKAAMWFGLMIDADPEHFLSLLERAAKDRWPESNTATDEASK